MIETFVIEAEAFRMLNKTRSILEKLANKKELGARNRDKLIRCWNNLGLVESDIKELILLRDRGNHAPS